MQFYSITTVNVSSLPYDFNNIFFTLAYFILRILYIIHTKYVTQLLILLIMLLVNSRHIKSFGASQKLYVDFQIHRGLMPLIPVLVKGQLYTLWCGHLGEEFDSQISRITHIFISLLNY